MSRFGRAVKAGKQKDFGSNPLRLSFLFKGVVVCGDCPVALFLTVNETLLKMALSVVHLNAGIILVVTV